MDKKLGTKFKKGKSEDDFIKKWNGKWTFLHFWTQSMCLVLSYVLSLLCVFFFKLTHIISIQLHNKPGKEVALFPMIEIRKLMCTLKKRWNRILTQVCGAPQPTFFPLLSSIILFSLHGRIKLWFHKTANKIGELWRCFNHH